MERHGAWGVGVRFSQGYLNRDKERTVRIRLAGERAFLTVRGVSGSASRAEFECEIPAADAEQLLKLSDGPIIEKTRRVIQLEGVTWEVDEFLGENAGLVIAEIELQAEDQVFEKTEWLGDEVTYDARYFNSTLVAQLFTNWHGRSTA